MLQHVSIEVRPDAAERMVEFWRLVGFEPVEAPAPLRGYVIWLERAGTQIHLIKTDGAIAPQLGHAAIVVGDWARTVERVREAGFEIERSRQLWDARRAFAIAPGGHRVELMESPPPASLG